MKEAGERVDRYIIEAFLGRGGMGEVYSARDTKLGRKVALKIIRSDDDEEDGVARARMLREARTNATFEHPNTVVVYDVGESDGTTFIAMELICGRSLKTLVGEPSIPLERRVRWLVDIARALAAAHHIGLIHRDIKPENVMIREDGMVKVLDFGLARWHMAAVPPSTADTPTLGGTSMESLIVGTMRYAAPEQLRGEPIDGRADEFAWGMTAYELLACRPPWVGQDTLAVVTQILLEDLAPLRSVAPEVPEPIAAVVERALSKSAEQRFATLDEVADALEPFAELLVVNSQRQPTSRGTWTRSSDPQRSTPTSPLVERSRSSAPEIEVRRSSRPPEDEPLRPGSAPGAHTQRATSSAPGSEALRKTPASVEHSLMPRPTPMQRMTSRASRDATTLPPPTPSDRETIPTAPPIEMQGPRESGKTPRSAVSLRDAIMVSRPAVIPPEHLPPSPDDRIEVAVSPRLRGWRRGILLPGAVVVLVALALIVRFGTGGEEQPTTLASAPPEVLPTRPIIDALACADAAIEGGEIAPEIARVLGVGACARLAAEVGVEWSAPNASHRLDVGAKVRPEGAEVTLSVAGRRATRRGSTPIEAVVAATDALASELTRAPMSADEVERWGARDEASARRIERVWRRKVLGVSPTIGAEIESLLETDPDSPWSHALAAMMGLWGAEALATERRTALDLAAKLPAGRADTLRGVLLLIPSEIDRREALRLLRLGYSEAPGDADMVNLYASLAIRLEAPEAFAVLDRLYAHFPTRSLTALDNALTRAPSHDPARDAKYAERLRETLPEAQAWMGSVKQWVSVGKLDEARASLELARRLGLHGAAAEPIYYESARAYIELASLEPEAAREMGSALVSDPRVYMASRGALVTIASYLLEGRIDEAESAMVQEIERLRGYGSLDLAASFTLQELKLRRWLSRPPPSASRLAWIEKALAEGAVTPKTLVASMRAELALAFVRESHRASAQEHAATALAAIEAMAGEVSDSEPSRRDAILVSAVALTREVRGASDAVKLWRRTDRAPFASRLGGALDAALAFESLGDLVGAEEAYLLAEDVSNVEDEAAQKMIASARLASLYRKMGRKEEAARRDALLARVWNDADPELPDAVQRMR